MSISLRGTAQQTGAGRRLPGCAFRSGAVRWCCLALLAGIVALASNNRADAQITVKSLIGKAVSDPTEETYPDVKSAIEYFMKRDPKGALGQLTVAKTHDAKLPPPDMMLAQMWIMANQSQQARAALEECIKDNPDDPEAYLALGDLAFTDHQFAAAELLFTKAEQLAGTFKENLKRATDFQGRAEAGLAAVAESREQWGKAETCLRNWLKIVDPTGAPPIEGETNTTAANAHDRLGRVLFRADKDPQKSKGAIAAHEQFMLAVADDNKSISADIALAQLYEDANMHEMAKKGIRHAVLNPPKDPATHLFTLLAAANWAIDTNQATEAFNYASEALKLDPNSKRAPDAKYLMGVAARMKGETKVAEQQLQEVYLASPANFRASNQLAQVLAEENDPEKKERGLEIAQINYAAAQAADSARRDPGRAIEAAATLGWAFYELGRYPEADQVTKAIAETGLASPDILYYRAKLLQEPHGQTQDAINALKAALSKSRGFFVHRDDAEAMLTKLDHNHASSSGTTSNPPTKTEPASTPPAENPPSSTPPSK
jgi:tetratricopeptide (TPR) repeat protein